MLFSKQITTVFVFYQFYWLFLYFPISFFLSLYVRTDRFDLITFLSKESFLFLSVLGFLFEWKAGDVFSYLINVNKWGTIHETGLTRNTYQIYIFHKLISPIFIQRGLNFERIFCVYWYLYISRNRFFTGFSKMEY